MENILEYVKEKWLQLTAFSKKEEIKEQLWEEIVYRYSGQHRHYHNLSHVAHLFSLCDKFIDQVTHPAVMGFSILYHDVIYDTYSRNNQQQSAVLAGMHLKQLNVNNTLIKNVQVFINATKDHTMSEETNLHKDLALFLDFDMAILGVDEDMYNLYSEKIRQEYAKYPDNFYKEGRKLALQKMLEAKTIFSTDDIRQVMEENARKNIKREVSHL